MKCRVCNGDVEPLEIVYNCRWDQFCLKKAPFNAITKNIQLYYCSSCLHLQTKYLLSDEFYDSYTDMEGAAQYFGALDLLDKKLMKVKNYVPDGGRLIDIGCGRGKSLRIAKKYFENCLGVEPSQVTSEIARTNGLNVINAYFDKTLNISKDWSAFVCFQVFEHLCELYSVLDYAYEVLEPGGIGLINVPNGQRIVEQALYHQIVCEHVNYFTPYSLGVMAKKSGFDILEIEAVDATIELDLYIRKPRRHSNFNFAREQHKIMLQKLMDGHKHITVWGAGAKSQIYAQLLGKTNPIEHLVDSSPDKAGLYVSGISLKIEAATQSIIDKSDLIVIFASAYNEEIISDLHNKYGYKNKIIYFEGERVLER